MTLVDVQENVLSELPHAAVERMRELTGYDCYRQLQADVVFPTVAELEVLATEVGGTERWLDEHQSKWLGTRNGLAHALQAREIFATTGRGAAMAVFLTTVRDDRRVDSLKLGSLVAIDARHFALRTGRHVWWIVGSYVAAIPC